MTRATRPVLDIRGLVVHRDGTLILDRLDWRVQCQCSRDSGRFSAYPSDAMSTLTISIPDSVRSRIEFFAGKDGVSVEHYVSTVLAQRIAVADADSLVQKRAKQGSTERLLELLAAAPDVSPEQQDRIVPKIG